MWRGYFITCTLSVKCNWLFFSSIKILSRNWIFLPSVWKIVTTETANLIKKNWIANLAQKISYVVIFHFLENHHPGNWPRSDHWGLISEIQGSQFMSCFYLHQAYYIENKWCKTNWETIDITRSYLINFMQTEKSMKAKLQLWSIFQCNWCYM